MLTGLTSAEHLHQAHGCSSSLASGRRVNNAPTRGYEGWVGSRTDIRVLNHVTLDVWMGFLADKHESRIQVTRGHMRGTCTRIGRRHVHVRECEGPKPSTRRETAVN